MFVCVVPLSQPSSRDLDYSLWDDHLHETKRYKEQNDYGFAYTYMRMGTGTSAYACTGIGTDMT